MWPRIIISWARIINVWPQIIISWARIINVWPRIIIAWAQINKYSPMSPEGHRRFGSKYESKPKI